MPGLPKHKTLAALRRAALAYPETTEEFPWGERVAKVRGKVFIFMSETDDGGFRMTVKLPRSGGAALALPCCEPTGYGLGRAGWVSVRPGPRDELPVPMLLEWLDESYRAIAPARLVKALDAEPTRKPR
jgi:predicted DNA-binding protein (MmcQ/YjbR family)